MRTWGTRSREVYDTLDDRLKLVADRVLLEVCDISLLHGYRGADLQNKLFAEGKSKLMYPQSKHNTYPSIAVDWQPYPCPTRKEKLWASLAYIAGHAQRMALEDGFVLRWGGDWNQNGDLTDNNFDDLYHIEVVGSIGNFSRANADADRLL